MERDAPQHALELRSISGFLRTILRLISVTKPDEILCFATKKVRFQSESTVHVTKQRLSQGYARLIARASLRVPHLQHSGDGHLGPAAICEHQVREQRHHLVEQGTHLPVCQVLPPR
jgi:hypothetical protein